MAGLYADESGLSVASSIKLFHIFVPRAAFISVGALGPDLIWATLNTPKKFCHVYSTKHPVNMNFYGHGRKVSLQGDL